MKEKFKNYWPIIVALITLLVIITVMLISALQQTRGRLIYALDDAYIHMAMAKNLVQHGVYGVTQYEFSSSSSSPLWTLLLAFFFFVLGVREWLPFVLNVLFASTILIVIFRIFRKIDLNNIISVIVLLAVVFFTPFPAMIFIGMEHLLHILLVVLFMWYLARILVEHDLVQNSSHFNMLCLLSVGVTMARFESYALLFTGCMLFILRGQWKRSLKLAIAGVLPLLVYQYISVSHGWFWLPNSILIRSNTSQLEVFNSQQAVVVNSVFSNLSEFLSYGILNLTFAMYVTVLVITACILLVVGWGRMKSFWKMGNILLTVYILIALAHLMFGKCGHFYRYEAYLVAVGLFVITYAVSELLATVYVWKLKNWKGIALGIVLLFSSYYVLSPLIERSKHSFIRNSWACRNIYEQQYQMGLFLKHFYPGASVAVNDIGAVSFLGDIRLLDLVGLASADVLKLKNVGVFTTEQIEKTCLEKNIAIAVVYDFWFLFEGIRGVPPSWKKVGAWKIPYNVICGSDVVSFYAVQASEEAYLSQSLQMFSYMLPVDVERYGP